MSALADILKEPPVVDWDPRLGSYLSASRLSMFTRCAEQYRRRYVLGEIERPAAALVWGGADHAAHEHNFRQKIDTHEDLPVDEVQDAFTTAFDRKVDENGGEAEVAWGDDTPADLKDRGVALVAAYHRQVSPTVQPFGVEERFEVRVPGVPVPVVGYMDVRAVVDGKRKAIERKTSAKKVTVPKADWILQGRLYQTVSELPVDWHVSTKTKVPAVYTPVEEPELALPLDAKLSTVTVRMVANTARIMSTYFAMFGPDESWPDALGHPWACSFCGFRPSCEWWGNS